MGEAYPSHKGGEKLEETVEASVHGVINRVIHVSADRTFYIMSMLTDDKNYITILGPLFGLKEKDEITVWGTVERHPRYGYQLKVNRWEKPVPTTADQVREFLVSSLVKGAGKTTAKRIVDKLGPDALNAILEGGPETLHGIKGISKKNAERIYRSLHETFEIQRIVMQLSAFGLTPKLAIRAYQHFGSSVVEMVRQNPYCLTRVSLIAFHRADEIARRLGLSPDNPNRIKAAIRYSLEEAASSGHCYLPVDELAEKSLNVLNHDEANLNLSHVYAQIGQDEDIIIDDNCVYLKPFYVAESSVAEKVKQLSGNTGTRIPQNKIETQVKKYEIANQIRLAPEQKEAIYKIFQHDFLILTGGPGTGKSTTVNAIIQVYNKLKNSAEILLAAPTGRASRRLAEITGRDAATIHRMLEIVPGAKPVYNSQNPLPADLVVIDEVSMLDIMLSRLTFNAIGHGTKVLLVGDADQLPSVGPGNVLHDLLQTDIPSVQLNKVFRQAAESQIITNAHRVNNGQPVSVDHSKGDFYFLRRENPADILKAIVASFKRFIELGYTVDDIQVLTPMKRGIIGTTELNKTLQAILNPPAPGKTELVRGGTTFRAGDKVMQIKNNYDKQIFNGEVGTVKGVIDLYDREGNPSGKGLVVKYQTEHITYSNDELDQITLAYAITTHKSQGGEWPIIITPVSTQHYIMLARNLLYTAITRAKQKVVLIGTEAALNIAINNDKVLRRYTGLTERLLNSKSHASPIIHPAAN